MRPPDRPTRQVLAALVKQGLTRKQIAERLGVGYFTVSDLVRIYGLNPVRAMWLVGRKKATKRVARDAVVMKLLGKGERPAAIGERFGISEERVYQIALTNGVARSTMRAESQRRPRTTDLVRRCYGIPETLAGRFQSEMRSLGFVMGRALAAGLLHFLDSSRDEQAKMLRRAFK